MKHVLFDLKECLISSPLDDEEYVKETLIEAAKVAKLELLRLILISFNLMVLLVMLYLQKVISAYTHGLKMMLQDVTYFHVIQTQIINL